jgi:hypothetical protein
VGKQAAKGVVGRLSYLLQNNMHLERLAICIPQPDSPRTGPKPQFISNKLPISLTYKITLQEGLGAADSTA